MDLITLADLPELDASKRPSTRIAVARLDDKLVDPRYGKFAITQADVDGWKRNLAGTFGGQVSIDFDHSSDRGRGTKAAAWITGLHQDGPLITADVRFTPSGAQAVRDGDYKYISPTFVADYKDEHGDRHGRALIGGGLTNRPVLRKGMPTLSLSRDVIEGVAVPQEMEDQRALSVDAAERKLALKEGNALPDGSYPIRNTAQLHAAAILAASGHGDAAAAKKLIKRRAKDLGVDPATLPGMGDEKKAMARDSRRQMDLSELRKLLSLDDDADEAAVTAKITELATPAEPKTDPAKPEPKTDPDAQTMTLSADAVAKLMADANAGAAAAVTLAEERFDRAWQKALSEGRAAPSQEDTLKELHAQNPDLAVKTLDSFVKIVPTKPTGSGEGVAAETPPGMDDDRFQLHTEAKTLAAQKVKDNPQLPADEAYILAVNEIHDRQFTLENPGI